MLTKICPICDQKLDHMNYCSVCKKWIRKPNYISVDYYLNERHPQEWHDCEYHSEAETFSEAPQTEERISSRKQEKRSKTDHSGKKTCLGKGCLTWLVVVFVLFQVGIPVLFSAADKIGDVLDDRFMTKIPETAASAEEEAVIEPTQTELTDSQVMELGQECDNRHMELQGEDAAAELLETLSERYNLVESSQSSTNLVDHSEFGDYKWFQTDMQMYFESAEDSERQVILDVYWDTFSKRVHEIGFHADEEDVLSVAETVFDVLVKYGVLAEKPESADSWGMLFENARTSMEEDYLWAEDPALEASELGMSLYYSEYDGKRRYFINVWSEASE